MLNCISNLWLKLISLIDEQSESILQVCMNSFRHLKNSYDNWWFIKTICTSFYWFPHIESFCHIKLFILKIQWSHSQIFSHSIILQSHIFTHNLNFTIPFCLISEPKEVYMFFLWTEEAPMVRSMAGRTGRQLEHRVRAEAWTHDPQHTSIYLWPHSSAARRIQYKLGQWYQRVPVWRGRWTLDEPR
jgi:hypothetical protein